MTLTGAEKAVIAAVLTFIAGLATEVVTLINQGEWNTQTTIVLVAWVITTLGTTGAVYARKNAPAL